jgi:pimeloyl-ACP methyl ester carboxylesterase
MIEQEDTAAVKVRGTALQVSRRGDGQTLLYLHGSNGAVGAANLQAALSKHTRCLVPRHPGFDGTEVPPWLDNVADLANFYLEFIEQEGLKKVHLAGHDLGGWIAAEMAVRNSSALASLTLISAQGIHVPDVPVADVFLRTDEQLAHQTFHDKMLAASAVEALRADSDAIALRNKEIVARLTWQPRGHDPQLAKWLHRISVPTLVLWGADDLILPPAYGKAWRSQIPGADLVSIADCGHAPDIEQPAAVATHFAKFISSTKAAA